MFAIAIMVCILPSVIVMIIALVCGGKSNSYGDYTPPRIERLYEHGPHETYVPDTHIPEPKAKDEHFVEKVLIAEALHDIWNS